MNKLDEAYWLPNCRHVEKSLLLSNRFHFANLLPEALTGGIKQ
jgi:hypothetical protein